MKKLVVNVFGNDGSVEKAGTIQMSSCRGWSRINLSRIVSMSSCRGWSRINLNRI